MGSPSARNRVVLKAGREQSLLRRHPWIFSGAIERVVGDIAAGDCVSIRTGEGRFLAWAAYNPHSRIAARVLSFEEADYPDDNWLKGRLARALDARGAIPDQEARRLVNAESDGLPGVIVDRYGDVLVLQLSTAGADRLRESIVQSLLSLTHCAGLYEKSDADSRELEGLEAREGWIRGTEVPFVEIVEHGLRYRVDFAGGQKTGFYLDQRDARARVKALAAGRKLLNCFCYTGSFAIAAMAGGASSVLSLDSSAAALDTARENTRLNGFDGAALEWQEADVFRELRRLRDTGRQFDFIILDPPKFAPSSRHAEAAARGYKDINLGAMRLLRPGGLLATFSCSSGVSADLFQKIVAGAAADAGISARIEGRFSAASDHPVLLEFPEGEYLKGLLLRRM